LHERLGLAVKFVNRLCEFTLKLLLPSLFLLDGLDLESGVFHRDGFAFIFESGAQVLGLTCLGLEFLKIFFGVLGRDVEIFASDVDDRLVDAKTPGDLDS